MQDVLKIMRHFDSRKDGQVSYNEFCDALLLSWKYPGQGRKLVFFWKDHSSIFAIP